MKINNAKSQSAYRNKLFEKNKVNLILSIILTVINSIFEVIIAFVLMRIINLISKGDKQEIFQFIIFCAIYMASYLIISFASRTFKHRFYYSGLYNYKKYVFTEVMGKNINVFDKNETSKYISALTNDLNSIETNYLESILSCIRYITLLVAGVFSMIYLNVILFLSVLAASLLPVLVTVIFGNRIQKYEENVSNRNADFMACLKDMFGGFAVIKSFKAEDAVSKVFEQKNESLEVTKKKRRDVLSTMEILSTITGIMTILVVFTVGSLLSVQGIITSGVIIAFIQLLNNVLGPIEQIPTLIGKMRGAQALMSKLEKLTEQQDFDNGKLQVDALKKKIRFQNVSFSYEENNNILKNFDFSIEKGKSYAIVGSSGSGKTTMLHLLLGYYNDYQGKIFVDDCELKDIDNQSLYSLFSIIQQEVFIFNDTIINNVTMFNDFKTEHVLEALEAAGLKQLIDERGTDYLCGENGNNLSGGERQRISIARCILKKTSVLLMDEATAALDSITAQKVEEEILGLGDIAKVIVTHKMNETLLSRFDEIILIKNGKVSERGNFCELIEKREDFYQLYMVSK